MPGARTVPLVLQPAGPGMGLRRVTAMPAPMLFLLRKAF